MKILAFNGSPRMENGATDVLLDKFLEGARAAGAQTEKIYLKRKKINNCISCFTCWTKTPGTCVSKDDMPEILEKLRAADIWVFATPVYCDTMTSYTKTLIERMLPFLMPFMEEQDGRTMHPLRYLEERGKHKMAIISVCGFPERANFEPLSHTFQKFSINFHAPVVAEIFMPAGSVLLSERSRRHFTKFLEAVSDAGREIVMKGNLSDKTGEILGKGPAIQHAFYRFLVNRWWKGKIKDSANADVERK